MKSSPRIRDKGLAFSLVEVALALGIMAFCLVAIIGLIPVGISSQQASAGQMKAVLAMEAMATCLRGMTRDSNSHCHVMLPGAELMELDFVPGGEPFSFSCGFTENGTFSGADDFGWTRCGTLHIQLHPPASDDETGRAYLTAAWPGAAVHEGAGWTRQSGVVETVVYFNLPQTD